VGRRTPRGVDPQHPQGDRAFLSYYQDGLRVLRLFPDRAPEQIGYYNTWSPRDPDSGSDVYEGAIGIDRVDRTVYLTDTLRGLIVFDAP
jgi:hypothetical protein